MTRKDYTLFFAFILLIIIICLSGCGVNYHLRKSNKHLEKAIAKGAIVNTDTIWKTLKIHIPKIEIDTVLKHVNFRDTITVEKDKIITRIKYDTISRTMFVSTECSPDTIEVIVPVVVNNKIKSPRGFWYYFQHMIFSAVIGFILGAIFWAALRTWLKSLF